MSRLRLLTLIATVLAAFALVGTACGSDEEPDEGAGPQTTQPQGTDTAGGGGGGATTGGDTGGTPAGGQVDIDMKNIEYVPKQATAQVGQKIVWTNGDTVPHTVTATSGADFDSGNMEPGDTFEFTVESAGTIEYFCEIHPNQTGTLEVSQ